MRQPIKKKATVSKHARKLSIDDRDWFFLVSPSGGVTIWTPDGDKHITNPNQVVKGDYDLGQQEKTSTGSITPRKIRDYIFKHILKKSDVVQKKADVEKDRSLRTQYLRKGLKCLNEGDLKQVTLWMGKTGGTVFNVEARSSRSTDSVRQLLEAELFERIKSPHVSRHAMARQLERAVELIEKLQQLSFKRYDDDLRSMKNALRIYKESVEGKLGLGE